MTSSFLPKVLFQEDWWLACTAPSQYRKIEHTSKYGTMYWPVATRSKGAGLLRDIYVPPLTIYGGPYFEAKRPLTRPEHFKILENSIPELIKQLPKFNRIKVNLTQFYDWWSPFYWEGFEQHTRYTSLLEGISDHDNVWKGFNSNTKRSINRASKEIEIIKSYDSAILYQLLTKTMENQSRRPGYSASSLQKIVKLVQEKNCGVIYTGIDKTGKPHSSLLCVWDDTQAYYLVGGTDPELRSSGAMALTMWTAIKEASNYTDIFNFEGSMQKGIDNFIRGFGAIPIPYSQISKWNLPFAR